LGRRLNRYKNDLDYQSVIIPHSSGEEDRIIYLSSDMTEYSVSNVIQQLFSLSKRDPKKPIHLVVSSYGGEIDSMFSLYDAMKFISCPVLTVGLGKIMSASVLILAAGQKNKRLIGSNARVMIHPIWGGSSGNVFEQRNEQKEMERLQEQMDKLLAKETGQSYKEIQKLMSKGHDFYLTAEDAIKIGIADKTIG